MENLHQLLLSELNEEVRLKIKTLENDMEKEKILRNELKENKHYVLERLKNASNEKLKQLIGGTQKNIEQLTKLIKKTNTNINNLTQNGGKRGSKKILNTNTNITYKRGSKIDYRRGSKIEHKRGSKLEHKKGSKIDHRRGSKIDYRRGSKIEHKRGSKMGYKIEHKKSKNKI